MKSARPALIAAAFIALTIWLGYFVRRDQFAQLTLGWMAFFPFIYFAKKNAPTSKSLGNWLVLGMFLRFLLLFSWPNLSDDFWRFIWDGRVWLAGGHPFSHPPDFYFEKNALPTGISSGLYENLNSKKFHTVYPPVCQAVFASAAFLGKNNDHAAVFFMKLFLFACECGTVFLLKKMADRPIRAGSALLYSLLPLPIFEVVGNGHFEGAMLFFMLASLFFYQKSGFESPHRGSRAVLPALFFALAIAVKLLPLMFLPLLFPILGIKNWLKFIGWLALFSAAIWLPMLDFEVLKNMGASLGLYFQAFEFNASFYYLIKPFTRRPEGFNRPELLGPLLGMTVVLIVFGLAAALYLKKIKPGPAFLTASMAQLLLAPTVHPWYILTPLLLSFFTKTRFAVVWAAVAVLSYSHYMQRPWSERFEIIGLEYLLVFVFLLLEAGRRYFLKNPRLNDGAKPNTGF